MNFLIQNKELAFDFWAGGVDVLIRASLFLFFKRKATANKSLIIKNSLEQLTK